MKNILLHRCLENSERVAPPRGSCTCKYWYNIKGIRQLISIGVARRIYGGYAIFRREKDIPRSLLDQAMPRLPRYRGLGGARKPEVRVARWRINAIRSHIPGLHTEEEWVEKFNFVFGLCSYCGIQLTLESNQPNTATKDHCQPISRGGSDSIENIVPACKSCNSKKGARTLEEFIR